MATKPFKGVIDVDIRKSTPDWEPYEQPKAPAGAPNVLFIVWDDTGFGAWSPSAAPSKMPTMDRLAARAGCATPSSTPPRFARRRAPRTADRTQSHHRRHGVHLRSHRPASPARTVTSPSRRRSSAKSWARRATTPTCWASGTAVPRTRPTWPPPSATGPPAAASSATTASWAARPTSGIPTWCKISSSRSNRPNRPRTGQRG